MSTDEKINTLLASFNSFEDMQLKSLQRLEKLQKFEEDLESVKESQEEVTERALKRVKRDQLLQFQWEDHDRFNSDIQVHVASAYRQLEKLAPPDKEKPIVEKAIKELQEGASSLAEWKKRIWFADKEENGWDTVAEYAG